MEQWGYILATIALETAYTYAPVTESYWLSERAANAYAEKLFIVKKEKNWEIKGEGQRS